MSKQNELRVFEKSIAIPSVRFTRTALEFDRVDEGTLVEAGAFLQAVDACSAWWWGDFLAAYCGYNLKQEEKEHVAQFDELTRADKLKQYSAKYSDICGKDLSTLTHWKGVANFYNFGRRRPELSWTHHREAKEGSDEDPAIADNWLDLAIKHNWSASQLRAAIRRKKRALLEPDEPLPQLLLPMEVVECRAWASATLSRVPDMDLKEATALLREMEMIIQVAAALTRRVHGVAKESILAAA